MTLEDELKNLPDLREVGAALAVYAVALVPGLSLMRNDKGRYVSQPHNFITITVHWQRASNISITIRGNPDEFAPLSELPLKKDQNGYSSFKVTEPAQLAAAAWYIRHAHEIYSRGRSRVPKQVKITES